MSLGLSFYLFSKSRQHGARRRRLLKENPSQMQALLGAPEARRPAGKLIWFHAADPEEIQAGQELIRRLSEDRDELSFLLTLPKWVASDAVLPELPPRTHLQVLPEDVPQFVRSFLDHWCPDVVVWSQKPDRPALILETSNRRIPIFLVDADASQARQKRWSLTNRLNTEVLHRFDRILATDETAAALFEQRGMLRNRVEVCGLLEEGSAALPCDEEERAAWAKTLAARPVWLAAYSSLIEDAIVAKAHWNASKLAHRLLLILVPDDPARGPDIAARLTRAGKNVALRSKNMAVTEDTQIYVADTKGEMGLWYRLSPVSFMGQSIDKCGGRNPFEPAALGSAVLHGPNISDHQQSYARLSRANAARQVADSCELAAEIKRLLAADKAAEMAHNAWEACSRGAEVTDRILELVFEQIDKAERS